jgi:hypothetical protein
MGKHYPAYHCSNYGHYFRIPKEEFEATVASFVKTLVFPQETVDNVMEIIGAEWQKRQGYEERAFVGLEERIRQLNNEAELTVNKIKMLSSETAIKYLEEDLMKIEKQIKALEAEITKKATQKKPDMQRVLNRVRALLERPEELFQKQIDPVKKAQFFGAFFENFPTFNDLKPGTKNAPIFTGVHPVFRLAAMEKSLMVTPAGFEPAIFWMRTRYPGPLDEGA